MEAKFAILEYAKGYNGLMPEYLDKSKTLRNRYIRMRLPYKTNEIHAMGIDGLRVTLPITPEDAESDERIKNDVFIGVLEELRSSGVRSVKAGFSYPFDYILPAASGFYILPFLLPVLLKKCGKMFDKSMSALEVFIIDGIFDLTIDILCVISSEINNITVFTENPESLQNAAYRFYADSGLFINITDKHEDMSASTADIILNASSEDDIFTNRYNKGALFLDMAGNKKKLSDISMRRPDILSADGLELKSDGQFIDNILLETILLADSKSFERYVFGRCGDGDFYDILAYTQKKEFTITSFLRKGKRAAAENSAP